MREIDIQTRTLYAELLEAMQVAEMSRDISSLKGSFSTKAVKGEEYVYFRFYSPGGQLEEVYVGKLNAQTELLMREHAAGRSSAAELDEKFKRLARQIMAGVEFATDKAMMRVIRRLADAGVFRNGGVLVGTHAFQAAGLALGACWTAEAARTSDIDLAVTRNVSVALPAADSDIPAALDSLKMGFFPVPRLSHKDPSTNFAIRNSQLRLDILTPKTSRSEAPVFIKRFNCAAEPLSYLSYLIESPIQAVLLDTSPVLVNIPQPARYAFHKLIVSRTRSVASDAKRPKDLYQAHQLLAVLLEQRPFDIEPAWKNLVARGPKWNKLALEGLSAMEKSFGKLDLALP